MVQSHVQDDRNIIEPYISVIITAFNRKEYLIKAVRSVLDQTLSREHFEIIVTKNFVDIEIDKFLQESQVRVINDPVEGLGKRIASALRETKGDIISFLEDDDLFQSNKLQEVIREFSRNPKLGFFHDAYLNMDFEGNHLTKSMLPNTKSILVFNGGNLTCRDILLMHRLSGAGHNSCISIRRTLVFSHIEKLKLIKGAVDAFLFYLSIQSDYQIIISPQVMTIYRVHNSVGVSTNSNFDEFVLKNRSNWSMYLSDINQMLKITERGAPHDILLCDLMELKLHLAIVDAVRRELLKSISKCIRCIGLRSTRQARLFILFAGVSVIYPKAFLRVLYVLKSYQIRNIVSSKIRGV